MCADTNPQAKPSEPQPKQDGGAEKVRSSRYEWELETAPAERRRKPRQFLKFSAIAAAVRRFLRALVNDSRRNPFDSDDDTDPMTA